MTPVERAKKLARFRCGLDAFPAMFKRMEMSAEPYPTFIEVTIVVHWPDGQEPMPFSSYRFPLEPMKSTENCLAWMLQEIELNPHTSQWMDSYLSEIDALL